jgi:MFS family permease
MEIPRLSPPFACVLANRNFRLLWLGGSLSVLGSQFSLIALPWLVLQLTNDPQALGLVLALAGLPRAVFMLVGGAITDRFAPRRVLVACDWLNFGLAAVIAGLVFTNNARLWIVAVFSMITGFLSGFVIPASNTMAPTLLPGDDLRAGNALNMGTIQLMSFIGPALAGMIIGSVTQSVVGIGVAFVVDAASFAMCAVVLGLIRETHRPAPAAVTQTASENVWNAIGVAARYLAQHRALRLVILIAAVVNFLFTGPLLVGIPVLADQRLVEGAAAFGLLMSAYAGGNLLGYVLAGTLPKPNGRWLTHIVIALAAGLGLALLVFGWSSATWLDFVLIAVLGVGNGYISLVLFTWVQQHTPPAMLGRVMSILMLAGTGLGPFSQALAGALSKWSLTGLFALSGGLMLLVALWLALNPDLKTLSEEMVG